MQRRFEHVRQACLLVADSVVRSQQDRLLYRTGEFREILSRPTYCLSLHVYTSPWAMLCQLSVPATRKNKKSNGSSHRPDQNRLDTVVVLKVNHADPTDRLGTLQEIKFWGKYGPRDVTPTVVPLPDKPLFFACSLRFYQSTV
jgi:hypothetical protein